MSRMIDFQADRAAAALLDVHRSARPVQRLVSSYSDCERSQTCRGLRLI